MTSNDSAASAAPNRARTDLARLTRRVSTVLRGASIGTQQLAVQAVIGGTPARSGR